MMRIRDTGASTSVQANMPQITNVPKFVTWDGVPDHKRFSALIVFFDAYGVYLSDNASDSITIETLYSNRI